MHKVWSSAHQKTKSRKFNLVFYERNILQSETNSPICFFSSKHKKDKSAMLRIPNLLKWY
jgi:hypothetical protein